MKNRLRHRKLEHRFSHRIKMKFNTFCNLQQAAFKKETILNVLNSTAFMCAFSFGVNGALVDGRNTVHLKVLGAKGLWFCITRINWTQEHSGRKTPQKTWQEVRKQEHEP